MKKTLLSDLRLRLLALVLIALLPAAALYVHTATEERARGLARAQSNALEEARHIARGQEYLIQGARSLLVALDELGPAVTRTGGPSCGAQLAALLRGAPYLLNAGITGLDGTLLCSAVAPPSPSVNFGAREWFVGAVKTGRFFVDRYRIDVITGKQALVLSSPDLDQAGRMRGVLFIALDVTALERLMESSRLPADSAITVLDRNGTVVARRPESGLVGRAARESDIVQMILARGEGSAEATGLDGVRRIYGFTPLSAGPEKAEVFVAVGLPAAFAYGAANAALWRNLSLLAVVGLCAIGIAWVSGEVTIARPIRTMVATTQRIGAGDLDARVGPRYPRGDLGTLARSFDGMAEALAARTAALRRAASELEATVERRTAELRRANDDLARSNADLEQFAYVASHDLQEPLRMVTSYLELIERRYADRLDERAHVFIGYAVDGAARMRALINDLLAYSRVGRRGTEREPTDATACVADALMNLSVAIQETHAVVTHDRLPTVRVNRQQLTMVFQNLVGNAVKFRGADAPRVHVSARREGSDWVFAVRDNGIGIAKEYHERIFTIFQRLHTREEYPGTGIGLAMCRKVVEQHGGRMWLESGQGAGSVFYFTMPASEEKTA